MRRHEHFEELCGLAAIDQLSHEQYREFLEHLRGCDACRRATEQFHLIMSEFPIPEPSAEDIDLQDLHSTSYKQRFIQRARSEGVRFTRDEFVEGKQRRLLLPRFSFGSFAFGVVSVAFLMLTAAAGFGPTVLRRIRARELSSNPAGTATLVRISTPAQTPQDSAVDENVARLELAKRESEGRLKTAQLELAALQTGYQQLLQQSQQWKDRAGQLQAEGEQTKLALAGAKSQIEKLGGDKDQLSASLVVQQLRIKELNNEVQNQLAAVERERQLTAAAKDVREMMGARNLHIVDVADLNGLGQPKKSFGRVFYAEGKSLIFYAFDLSQKGSAAKVAFQAWGQAPGGRSVPRNLGVFHIDDQAQKRWVLRVDDPQLLSSVESVFVTVEPAPGRDRPSGQKLLYAYLGLPANHQ